MTQLVLREIRNVSRYAFHFTTTAVCATLTTMSISDMDTRWESAIMYAPQVLRAVEDLVSDRETAGLELTTEERATLNVIRRDAMHSILQEKDRQVFEELTRLKEVELKYLHQVRGIRQVIPSAIFGDGYLGYGNGWTGNKMRLLYAQDRKRAGRQSREIMIPIQLQKSTQFLDEELVALRIDFENDKYRLRDTFTWNIKDKTVNLNIFVENMLEDFCLPLNLSNQVAQLIQEQLDAHASHHYPQIEAPETPEDSPYDEDMRITVKIDITIGQHTLTDQFEWDMNCRENSPEDFAEATVREMCLPPEFSTAIAHSIREQCQAHTKMLYLVGHNFDGHPVTDRELLEEISPKVSGSSFLRAPTLLPAFTPVLQQLPNADMDRQDMDRESRRRRRLGRTTRRGGGAYAQFQQPTSISELKEPCRVADTPVYSSLLPGGIDKNLDILRMYVCNSEEQDGERESLRLYTKLRQTRGIPNASRFSLDIPMTNQQRYIVKLKLPKVKRQP